MSVLIKYLLTLISLLVIGFFLFNIFYRKDYVSSGRLSSLSVFLTVVLYFSWGGMPIIYLPEYWPSSHIHPFLFIIGWGAVLSGLCILSVSIFSLGLFRSLGRQQNSLHMMGIYRVSRNPQVMGCILYAAGFTILWPSWFAGVWLVIFLFLTRWMIISEEEHLYQRFGRKYDKYLTHVPRYF